MPEEVKGTPLVESIEEDYKTSYAYQVCEFVQMNFPDEFNRRFRSFDECVHAATRAADVWFDKWKVKYPAGLLSRLAAYK